MPPTSPRGLVAGELSRRGVEVVGPVVGGRTGVVVSLSDGGARSMLTDRGVGPLLPADAIDPAWLDGCAWLHLSAYALIRNPVQGGGPGRGERGGGQSLGPAERRPLVHSGDRRVRGGGVP